MKLGIDFETYFAQGYSLSKLPTILYVRDPRFKAHGAAVKIDTNPAFWVTARDLADFYASIDWPSTQLYGHNLLFDGLILTEKFKRTPAQRVDTLGLARALLEPNVRKDLAGLAKALKLGTKGEELALAKGLVDLPPEIETQIAAYSINDIELTRGVYDTLYDDLPEEERILLDLTIRWGTEAQLNVNRDLLARALAEAKHARAAVIKASGYTATELRSAKQFPEIVRGLGIEPPTKLNPKGETTYAFAARDAQFAKLRSDYPQYEHIWAGRLAATSSNTIAKLETFEKATRTSPTIIMPTNYYGAHTGRWSGAGGLNVQALERGSAARLALEAPADHYVIVVDSSQIELRMNAWYCKQLSTLDLLRTGQDPYSATATNHFGYEVTKKMPERQFGKALELALGYGMGSEKFRAQAAVGIMGTPPVNLTPEEAEVAVSKYRTSHSSIKGLWRWLHDSAIPYMAGSNPEPLAWAGDRTCAHFVPYECLLPNGLALRYPNLRNICEDDGTNQRYIYDTTEGTVDLYGAALLENIVQALARITVGHQIVEATRALPDLRTVSTSHDELIGLIPIPQAEAALATLITIFSTPPTWAPDLPLAAEGGYAYNYSK